MKKVKWNKTKRLLPGDKFPFFRDNKEAFLELKRGNVVEVPEEVYEALKENGVVLTSENTVVKKKTIKEEVVIDENKVTANVCKTC